MASIKRFIIIATYALLSWSQSLGQSGDPAMAADSVRKVLESRHFILMDEDMSCFIMVDSAFVHAIYKPHVRALPYNLGGGSFTTPLRKWHLKTHGSGYSLEISTGINIHIVFNIRGDGNASAVMSTSRESGLFNGQPEMTLNGKLISIYTGKQGFARLLVNP